MHDCTILYIKINILISVVFFLTTHRDLIVVSADRSLLVALETELVVSLVGNIAMETATCVCGGQSSEKPWNATSPLTELG